MPTGTCKVDGCENVGRLTKGLCNTHYMRLLRTGSEHTVRSPGKPGDKRKHPMYGAWAAMINRCTNPNNTSYARYGALGITVCDRWRQDFYNFLADMGERPKGMTLDRIDGTKGYSPDNCRWADSKTQRANITPDGDRAMREGTSKGSKKYWKKWRIENGRLPTETWRKRRNKSLTVADYLEF